ncbi:MAG: hypothetical protein K2N06_05415 [Oscillospiraceae bacterium]|nr:hypothetical protein [Oscillospiraceae bacterium]
MNSKAYKSYEISKNEYRELKYFCLRYPEMKKQLEEIDSHSEKALRLCYSFGQIDHALELTTENEIVRGHLLRSVTENINYERLDVPMGRQQFYELRRKFFYILKTLKMG